MRIGLALATALLSSAINTAWAEAPEWKEIGDENGIKVWQREVVGSSLVEFRGRGEVGVHMKQILAVLHDNERKTEWMNRCAENRLVQTKAPGFSVIYNRTGSSVPLVDDRDVVVQTTLTHDVAKRSVFIAINSISHPLAPPIEGVVRMPKLTASWTLVGKDAKRTEVTYQVQADPGGMLPSWVVNLVSKDIPFKTISNLREQVKKSGYDKSLMVVEAAFDWESIPTN